MPLFLAAILAVLLVSPAQSQQTLNVPSTAYPTIQSAINAALAGDTVMIAAGSYGGGVTCDKAITLSGAGKGITVMDPNYSSFGINISLSPGESMTLRDMTITRANGCVNLAGSTSTLNVENCEISFGQRMLGSGISALPGTSLTLQNTDFLSNGLLSNGIPPNHNEGAAVYAGGHVTATDCRFIGNAAQAPAGMANSGGQSAAVLIISSSSFLGNTTASFLRCLFENNVANSATCIGIQSGTASQTDLSVVDCIFRDNMALNGIAAISKMDAANGTATLVNSLFTGNSGVNTITKLCSLDANFITISHCTFAENDPSYPQALIELDSTGVIKLRNSIFSNNGTDYLRILQPTLSVSSYIANLSSTSNLPGNGLAVGNIVGISAGFRDIANGDFRLLAGSPAINAGQSDPMDPSTDLDGLPRNQLGAPDMGCYELQPGEEDPGGNWAGTVPDLMGGLEDVLLVNGTAGDAGRRVNIDIGSTTTIAVDAAPGTMTGNFIIWGRIGLPAPIEAFPIPFAQGSMAFLPHLLALGNPSLFTFASSSLPGGLFATAPAPWSITGSSLPFPLTITLQGLIETGGSNVRLTNAIAVHNF